MVCAIVAMCTNQVQRGLILLLSSFASIALCAVIFFAGIFGAMFGALGLAAQKARQQQNLLSASGIAVLPFESLSSDKENAFFADGLYDGVSTQLAKLANLKVISHNSVAKYRGARNTQEIGRALNVPYVLKGSVRKEARRIHLNAQLIDTRTDARVWAQEYDGDLNDMFALQSEIAQKVADQVSSLSGSREEHVR
jgi:adenylate cyclase